MSHVHVEDAATATAAAIEHGRRCIYNVVDDEPAPVRAHPADQQALHNLVALLEREDPVVLSPHYAELLDQARQRVLPDEDSLPG